MCLTMKNKHIFILIGINYKTGGNTPGSSFSRIVRLFEGRSSWLALHRDSLQATPNPGKPKQDVLFKKLDFEQIGVNQRSN